MIKILNKIDWHFAILLVFILGIVLACVSCSTSKQESTIENTVKYTIYNTNNTPIITNYGDNTINEYIIDSCEYLGSVYGNHRDILTHKGNCKNKQHKK